MGKVSKRARANAELIADKDEMPLDDALSLMKKAQAAKFDETVELAVRLGIDVKKSDQMVRGAVSLPRGIGRELTVIAFAKGDKVEEAKEAGASEVGGEELAKKIQGGWMDFDVVVAAPDMMGVVGRLGRVLGPQGKMPSPKSGTVTPNVGAAVKEFKAGKVTVRADAGGIVHAPVGKRSFENDAIAENIHALMAYIRSLKPAASKGAYVVTTYMSTTMGPGIKVAGI